MNTIKKVILAAGFVALTMLLSGCKFILLNPKGIIATDEKQIMITSVLLMLIVVVPVIVLTVFFAWRYRAGNTKANYSPDWSHNTLLEAVCWLVPCIIIGILGTITWTSSHRLDPYKPLDVNGSRTITIQAIALEWKWLFVYPDYNIATVNFVALPIDVPVRFEITAEGPMNSFQIPQLAGQIYAMAGMTTKLHLMANAVGDYQGMSVSFSGKGFSDMQFTVRATRQAEFDEWVKTTRQSPQTLTMLTYNQLLLPSENNPVQYFSAARENLFETIVMKSMMPDHEMKENLAKK